MTGDAMRCCAKCFGDSFLRKQIEKDGENTGRCCYCGASNTTLIKPVKLRDYFELLSEIYCEDLVGKPLVEWFKSDWNLFDGLDSAYCNKLLSEILDDKEIVCKTYRPLVADDGTSLERWQNFREELKHENRFFPKNIPYFERLRELLEGHLCSDSDTIPNVLYRARIMEGAIPHLPEEMGMPPLNISSHGRANPTGIPYLYLTSDISTAIAEIRPHTGENVCVAEFRVISQLRIADLRNPRKTISPFSLSDEQDIAQLRNDIDFLCQLGEELSRPVLPKAAHLEYLPSQYLCEFIKHCGFDGVMYLSSIGKGTNYAIFDGVSTKVGTVTTYTVTCVSVDIEETHGSIAVSR